MASSEWVEFRNHVVTTGLARLYVELQDFFEMVVTRACLSSMFIFGWWSLDQFSLLHLLELDCSSCYVWFLL